MTKREKSSRKRMLSRKRRRVRSGTRGNRVSNLKKIIVRRRASGRGE